MHVCVRARLSGLKFMHSYVRSTHTDVCARFAFRTTDDSIRGWTDIARLIAVLPCNPHYIICDASDAESVASISIDEALLMAMSLCCLLYDEVVGPLAFKGRMLFEIVILWQRTVLNECEVI